MGSSVRYRGSWGSVSRGGEPREELDVPELRGRVEGKSALSSDEIKDREERAHLLNHVTFRMPTLVLLIPVDLDELLEDRNSTADALRRESGAVVEVAD